MTTTETVLLTADEFFRLDHRDVRCELVRGVIHKTMLSGALQGRIVTNLVGELRAYTKPRRLGTLLASDTGVWLERDPDTVRAPDVAFISADRLPLDSWNRHFCTVVPDLAAEVASPRDSRRALDERARMWLDHGVRLVWVVKPKTRSVDTYRPGAPAATLTGSDILAAADVLPGFACAVSTIFDS